jgi:DNA-binding NarL/FixJ family response regulator
MMRIFLADDEARVRSALRLLLEQQPDLVVVGEAEAGAALLPEVGATQPDLLLVDWELPGPPVSSLVDALKELAPALIVVALSGRPESRRAAAQAGADGFVSKVDPPEKILGTLRRLSPIADTTDEGRRA